MKKVGVCNRCSGFDVAELKDKVRVKECSTGCTGKCAGTFPELDGKVYGFLAGDFVVCDTADTIKRLYANVPLCSRDVCFLNSFQLLFPRT